MSNIEQILKNFLGEDAEIQPIQSNNEALLLQILAKGGAGGGGGGGVVYITPTIDMNAKIIKLGRSYADVQQMVSNNILPIVLFGAEGAGYFTGIYEDTSSDMPYEVFFMQLGNHLDEIIFEAANEDEELVYYFSSDSGHTQA